MATELEQVVLEMKLIDFEAQMLLLQTLKPRQRS